MVSINDILRQSQSAVCGITEREIVVPRSKVRAYLNVLKRNGFIIVGTGEAGFGNTKIWFAKLAF